jgi:hypothetical protein
VTAVQLDLIGTSPADAEKDAVLALIAGDRIHAHDRALIVDAIRDSVRPDGTVTSNDWRDRLAGVVYSRVIGATVNALTKAGVLVPTGEWVVSDDTHGRNSGRPMRRYRWAGVPS